MLHRTLKTHKSLHILLQIQAQHNFVSALVACLWFFSYIFKLARVSLLSIGNLRGIHRTNCNTKLQLKIEFCVETMKNTQHNSAFFRNTRLWTIFEFDVFILNFRPFSSFVLRNFLFWACCNTKVPFSATQNGHFVLQRAHFAILLCVARCTRQALCNTNTQIPLKIESIGILGELSLF